MSIETSPPATAPPASSSADKSGPTTTVCQNCQTSTTPLWRRDESGQVLCNACGLFLKLHGRNRPISLKTDVIKSRNRSRSTHANHLKASNKHHNQQHMPQHQQRTTGPQPVHHIAMAPYGMIPPHMQYPTMPTTPSSVFSYPNSPTLGPVNRYVINSTPASLANSPRLNPYAPQQAVPPTLLPPPRNVQTAHNSPAVTPVGGRSPLPSLASLAHVSHAPSAPPPQPQPQPLPQALAHPPPPHPQPVAQPPAVVAQPPPPQQMPQPPQPQPQPDQQHPHQLHHLPHHIPIHHHNQHYNIHQPRNVMSEQLRPHSPDGLERIPALKMEYGRRASSSYSSPQSSSKPPGANGSVGGGEKSRVTELELVNDLLRSRVTQLEQAEAAAREEVYAARARIAELERQVGSTKRAAATTVAAESTATKVVQEPQVKRIRVSDML